MATLTSVLECPVPLSRRAENVLVTPDVVMEASHVIDDDLYNKNDNPKGFINLGIAESKLCEDIIMQKFSEISKIHEDSSLLYYQDMKGPPQFREAMRIFMNKFFKPNHDIDVNNLIALSSSTSAMEALAFCLADPGDYFISATPYYYQLSADINTKADVKMLEVPMDCMVDNIYDINKIETYYKAAVQKGCKIRAICVINPHNPIGYVLTRGQLVSIMEFADRYKLHVIMDEVYALSVFDKSHHDFTSSLSLNLPDPNTVHVIWGVSKDFGLSGYRVGVLYSRNDKVIEYCHNIINFAQPASCVLHRLEALLSDTDWIENTYLPVHLKRLKESYTLTRTRLERHGIRVYPSQATFFIWADVSKFMKEKTREEEEKLLKRFYKSKVYLLTGTQNHCNEPGWIRLVFSVKPEELLIALDRLDDLFTTLTMETV